MNKTLARLCFFMPDDQVAPFEDAYERALAPFLAQEGWSVAPRDAGAKVAGVFSRLFFEESPGAIEQKRRLLRTSAAWSARLEELKARFGLAGGNGYRLEILQGPAGPGRSIPAAGGRRYRLWSSYGAQDGLLVPLVQTMLEDRRGGLWLGMTRGACYFDAGQFLTYSRDDGLVSDYVLSLAQDREDRLWFGTNSGISLYDGARFASLTPADGLVGNHVRCLVEDERGGMWIGTSQGLSYWDGARFANFGCADGLAHHNILALCLDAARRLWIGTEQGLSCRDGDRFFNFGRADGLCHQKVWALCQARSGELWIGTEGGANCYDGRRFTRLNKEDGLAHDTVRAVRQDRQGNVWFGTGVEGCSRYDGRRFENFSMRDGLAHNHVRAILEDRQGNVWFSTGGGISCYNSLYLSLYTTGEGLPSDGVVALYRDRRGTIWAGTWYGVAYSEDGTFKTLEAMRGKNVWSICEDGRGHMWFGLYEGGVCRYDGDAIRAFSTQDGLADHTVSAMLEDGDGRMWFGTGRGVCWCEGEAFYTLGAEEGFEQPGVYALCLDRRGRLWVGTAEGVNYSDGERLVPWGAEDGLACEVFSIYEDRRGTLWFGTNRGLSRYDGREVVHFGREEGLDQGFVMTIAEDGRGHLWLGTFGGGAFRSDGDIFQLISTRDGLAHDAVHQVLSDERGDVWIATEGGLVRYRSAQEPPTVHLKGIAADQWYEAGKEQLSIPVSQQLAVVEFEGASPSTRAAGLVFRHRLVGRDARWQTTRERRVEVRGLEEGDYTFEVRCADRDLNYSSTARLDIKVVPDPIVESLSQVLSGEHGPGFIGTSPALASVQALLAEVAGTEVTVLITGETGTGKGLAARALHGMSRRRRGPFIQVNCGALPENLVESELFGHEKGAFTGALGRKLGKVEVARSGTLFLDEIGDLPLGAQVKLLSFLQSHTFERVGGTKALVADVRIAAATNRDLALMVQQGTFREDLYFRLQVFPLHLPPLRQRREDIPLLATLFMERMASHLNKAVRQFHPEVLALLEQYEWPGNVRELEHVVQRAVIVCRGTQIEQADITLIGRPEQRGGAPAIKGGRDDGFTTLEEHERRYICEVLEATGWVVKGPRGAARILGMHDATLRGRMRKLGIVRPQGR